MVYVGIDVHRKRSQVAVIDESGTELLNRRVDNASSELHDLLEDLDPGTPVAFEAAYGWGWLADLLDDYRLEAHLTHPTACKAIASARLKNDKVDARMLAHLLRTDLLPEAWIAPRDVRDLRAMLRHRASLVRLRTTLKNRIRAILADEGVKAEGEHLWSERGRNWLASLPLRPRHRQMVEHCCELLDALDGPIAELDAQILRHGKDDPRAEALRTLPGVGPVVALTLLAEIGEISRFATARKLCAWAGLTPMVRNSDLKVRHGHITKAGPASVRFVLTEAAHVARRYPIYAATFDRIAARRGKHIATVAVARKLLSRCFHVLAALEVRS